MSYYYNIEDDLKTYPDAWVYIIIGGRNTGKTYGSLKSCLMSRRKFTFTKRTNEDVKMLCAGSGKVGSKATEYGIDLSPFKSINRDVGSSVKAFDIDKGLGGFWNTNDDGSASGQPIGYIVSLNAVSKVKGFDLSECEWLIFDEFIPQPWERVSRKEGEQIMDLYKTIARDREHRQLPALKLIGLANAVSISNPLMNILEITDIVADMQVKKIAKYYDEDRGIFIHLLTDNADFKENESKSAIYKAMKDTAWGQMALENQFSYNDFSCIGHVNLKGYKPVCSFSCKTSVYYIYQKDGMYYMTHAKNNSELFYDLNRENDQKRFFLDFVLDLRESCIDGRFIFETYTMYDLIINYNKIFKL